MFKQFYVLYINLEAQDFNEILLCKSKNRVPSDNIRACHVEQVMIPRNLVNADFSI